MLTPGYKRYALLLIIALYAVNGFDRGLMGLLLQPIKQDLGLSDTQVGIMTGIAFAVFYAAVGIPIGRWADRGNRVLIITLASAVGALASMAFLVVTTYVQLLVLRVFAAVSDAGIKPLTYSLVGDYFPAQAERTRAMYVWYLGAPVAGLVSLVLGGWLNERYGWREVFFLSGLLCLPIAILAQVTLSEPRLTGPREDVSRSLPPMKEVLATLWRQPSLRHLTLAMILMYTVGIGEGTWQGAFMIRAHGIGTAELGLWLGLISGGGGIVSLVVGGYVIDRWFAENDRAQLWLSAAALAARMPLFLLFLVVPTKDAALWVLFLQSLLLGAFLVSPYVMLQRLVPDDMRATSLMVVLFLVNLIGMGVGPFIVGALSDLLTPRMGSADGLRYAMMIMTIGYVWAAYHFVRAARTIVRDLAAAPTASA